MDYYTAMADAMIDAEKRSFLPSELGREQMIFRIEEITEFLKKSRGRSDERIILSAQRQELRLRLQRAEQVANRLLWK